MRIHLRNTVFQIFDKLKQHDFEENIMFGISRQLRSVIEWANSSPEILFERWTENGDEIKNASKLIVGPGQGCVFVYEGRVEAVFTSQGLYELRTANIPFWTTITKFMQAFRSEHRVGLYFFRTAQITNQKWGTTSPVKYEDPTYRFPVGLLAFGNFSVEIQRGSAFKKNMSKQVWILVRLNVQMDQ